MQEKQIYLIEEQATINKYEDPFRSVVFHVLNISWVYDVYRILKRNQQLTVYHLLKRNRLLKNNIP